MKDLILSLKKEWFDMTNSGEKCEDYREITPYWVNRLFHHKDSRLTTEQIVRYINFFDYYGYADVSAIFNHDIPFKEFQQNVMRLSCPSNNDKDRIIQFEHAGIEIRTGNPDWGAEEGKLYFVIKHGKRI